MAQVATSVRYLWLRQVLLFHVSAKQGKLNFKYETQKVAEINFKMKQKTIEKENDIQNQNNFECATFLGFINNYNVKKKKTSNDIIAGNGRILKVYIFIVQLYLCKKIYHVSMFFLFFFRCIVLLYIMFIK